MEYFFSVYVLMSKKDDSFYIGYTNDVKRRLAEHNNGKVLSTRNKAPFKLIYLEGCLNTDDAVEREKYLKTSWGKKYIRERLKRYLAE